MDGIKTGEMKWDVVTLRGVWVRYAIPAVYRTRIVYSVNVGSYDGKTLHEALTNLVKEKLR